MYEKILKPILFHFDPERVHDFFTPFGECLGSNFFTRRIVALACDYRHPSLETTVAGIRFKNPIGLGAGFDKDMRLTKIMPAVGFGFMEVGAITRFPYAGNDGLRLARLPDDKALIVYYGLKNNGAEVAAQKLKTLTFHFPVGLNIAKTNRADIKGEASIADYVATYRMLVRRFAYVTINISCPNAQDGCTFQDPVMLNALLHALAKEEKPRPVFLKISAHLLRDEVDAILAVAGKYHFIDGFVVANLAKDRSMLRLRSSPEALDVIPAGGISGAPMRRLSTDMIRHIYRVTEGKYILIGLGGVFTAEDAYEKIRAGASLVQMVTGLVYGGPTAVRRINRGLVKLLARDGYATIAAAVGKGVEMA
ncbi:MAG TPA: quinone-dependent dihydroorotate dehydrogenase [Candidatus Paceibacterota bacterium]|nr:quinone-dependent dihydroorotate dehydrogenase [Candidatus Paceibacterota bacterium]